MGFRRAHGWLFFLIAVMLAGCGGGNSGGEGNSGGGGGGTVAAGAPAISTQPMAQSVASGGNVMFTVAATGNGTLTYQWRLNGTAISGGTSATLTLNSVTAANAGSYDCVITNSLSGTTASTTSGAAVLTVVQSPTSATISGENAVLPNSSNHMAAVSAQPGATYTWSVTNGTINSGQGSALITYTAGHLGPLQVAVTVSNIAGAVIAVKNVVVAASLPIVSLFAQSSVLIGTTNILASVSGGGSTFGWALTPGTTSVVPTAHPGNGGLYSYNAGSTPGSYQLTVNVSDAGGNGASATHSYGVVQNTFVRDVRDVAPRSLHTATLMNDGRVLVVGGDAGIPGGSGGVPSVGSQSRIVGTAEVYDPVTTTWAFVASLSTPRFEHSATLLDDGRVLVAGGSDASGATLASVEIYDPLTQTWSAGASMLTARALHTATLLADGRVLVAGGVNANGMLATAEVYDPTADSWSSAATMTTPRVLQSATLLPGGQVLLAGGRSSTQAPIDSAERYDPASNTWKAAASMLEPESGMGAVLLVSGKVLQLGQESELYDPVADSWSLSVPEPSNRFPQVQYGVQGSTAILMPDGHVLAAGGFLNLNKVVGVYDPVAQSWTLTSWTTTLFSSATGLGDGTVLLVGGITPGAQAAASAQIVSPQNVVPLGSGAHAGAGAAASLLTDGRLLVTGGTNLGTTETNADVFDPATNLWSAVAPISTARSRHQSTTLANGSVLVTGGLDGPSALLASAELYNPTTNAWTPAGTMSSVRYQHTATSLGSGMVLVAGGSAQLDQPSSCSCTTYLSSADLYNPANNTWTPTGPLLTARYSHTATVLTNGKILVTGGFGGATSTLQNIGAVLASAELYDPTSGTWSAAAPMSVARMNHTATLLPSGKVLVTGGTDGTLTLATAEVYDAASNTWTPAASLATPRQYQAAQILASGSVLVVGGLNDSSSATFGVASAELYDPAANTWSSAGALVTARQNFILAALGDGRVLLDGGSSYAAGLPEFYH